MTTALNFRFASSEAAPKLPDSAGEAKGRLHLFEYNGASDQHRYAVAAEKVTFLFSLFWCFLQNWYIIHEQQEGSDIVQYRIPKASLKKRLGISDEKVESLADAAKFKKLIEKRDDQIKSWTNPTDNIFAQNFVAELIKNKIPGIGKVVFIKSSAPTPILLPSMTIGCQDISTAPEFKPEECRLALKHKRFKAIEKGKALLPSELAQIFDPGNSYKDIFEGFLKDSTETQIWVLRGKKVQLITYHLGDSLPFFDRAFGVGKTTTGIRHLWANTSMGSCVTNSCSKEDIHMELPGWVPNQEFLDWHATVP